jgi:hypothetical protein
MDRLDAKRIAAWNEIPEATQTAIRKALAKKNRLGATVSLKADDHGCCKTALGYVVFAGFVTPLARDLIEAVDFNATELEQANG